MAARQKNNPRVSNRGAVEDFHCLDIRELAASGAIAKGARTVWTEYRTEPTLTITADLRLPSQASMRVEDFHGTQTVAIAWKVNRANRQRLFFIDDTGRHCEKLYRVDGRFVSRQVGKLTFRSQSHGKEARLRALQAPVRKGLEATRTPLDERFRLKRRLDALEDGISNLDFDLWQSKWDFKKQAEAQRSAIRSRLKLARKNLRQRSHVNGSYIIGKHAGRLEEIRRNAPRAEVESDPWTVEQERTALPQISSEAVLDIDLLRRMRLLRRGQLTAFELGWPIKWLPQRRRQIHVLLDQRDRARAGVLIIFQTPKRVITQFFWITCCGMRRGADIWTFEEPVTGQRSPILAYVGGRFELAERPPLTTLHSVLIRLRQLRFEKCLSGRQELTDEHVQILQKLRSMPEFLNMTEDLLNDLAELGARNLDPHFDANSSKGVAKKKSAQKILHLAH
jgi:hypothetical protein